MSITLDDYVKDRVHNSVYLRRYGHGYGYGYGHISSHH